MFWLSCFLFSVDDVLFGLIVFFYCLCYFVVWILCLNSALLHVFCVGFDFGLIFWVFVVYLVGYLVFWCFWHCLIIWLVFDFLLFWLLCDLTCGGLFGLGLTVVAFGWLDFVGSNCFSFSFLLMILIWFNVFVLLMLC